MTWLTWRQLRTQTAVAYLLAAAFVVVLALTGPELVRLSHLSGSVFDRLTRTERNLFTTGTMVLAVMPALLGAFWGAPLVAREVENGTHRLAWNQSVTRTRWLATKLAVTALFAALAASALTVAITWWASPIDGAQSDTRGSLADRLTPVTFAMRGVVPVAYAVFAVVLGVAIGAVLRRSVPAMALTLAIYTFLQIAVPFWVRPHLIPPVQRDLTFAGSTLDSIEIPGPGEPVRITLATGAKGDWLLANYSIDASGHPTNLPAWVADCLPGPGQGAGPLGVGKGKGSAIRDCFTRLDAAGYRQHLSYQPASRFWPLQWAETALYAVLAGLLTAFCVWWVRTRVT